MEYSRYTLTYRSPVKNETIVRERILPDGMPFRRLVDNDLMNMGIDHGDTITITIDSTNAQRDPVTGLVGEIDDSQDDGMTRYPVERSADVSGTVTVQPQYINQDVEDILIVNAQRWRESVHEVREGVFIGVVSDKEQLIHRESLYRLADGSFVLHVGMRDEWRRFDSRTARIWLEWCGYEVPADVIAASEEDDD